MNGGNLPSYATYLNLFDGNKDLLPDWVVWDMYQICAPFPSPSDDDIDVDEHNADNAINTGGDGFPDFPGLPDGDHWHADGEATLRFNTGQGGSSQSISIDWPYAAVMSAGAGFASTQEYVYRVDKVSNTTRADINGDGVVDRLLETQQQTTGIRTTKFRFGYPQDPFSLSAETGFWQVPQAFDQLLFTNQSNDSSDDVAVTSFSRSTGKLPSTLRTAMIDWNGDGLADALQLNKLHLNTGAGFMEQGLEVIGSGLSLGQQMDDTENGSPGNNKRFGVRYEKVRLSDIDADGIPDRIELPDNGSNSVKVRLGRGDFRFMPEFVIPGGKLMRALRSAVYIGAAGQGENQNDPQVNWTQEGQFTDFTGKCPALPHEIYR